MTDQSNPDETTAASLANAQQNAGYPATAGDVDAAGALTIDQVPDTADKVVAWIGEGSSPEDRQSRADLAEQAENDRSGDNRATVTAAIDQARQPS